MHDCHLFFHNFCTTISGHNSPSSILAIETRAGDFCSLHMEEKRWNVNSITGPTEKVRAQSLVALCYSAGSILGNAYAGTVLDLCGLQIMLIGSAIFNIAAGLLLLKNTNQ